MLGLKTDARKEFERAATLFPQAQSPLLALSWLSRSGGDSRGAELAIERLFALRIKDSMPEDPWWDYLVDSTRDAKDLIANMRRAFGGIPR